MPAILTIAAVVYRDILCSVVYMILRSMCLSAASKARIQAKAIFLFGIAVVILLANILEIVFGVHL